eukprot:TRINITY_DN11808_c0_g1_i2.p1 TRINITY_DN11808_c0_g1~~TRINITY_DN11808_c0_g1_i2.p1  ORF type:complete len:331 (-),score=60.05 TRINITY_DN11808_c0_g1_i2:41-997(-)
MDIFEASPGEMSEELREQGIKALVHMLKQFETMDKPGLLAMGLDMYSPGLDSRVKANLDRIHWQLSMFYRHSKPTKIGLAVRHLRWIIENCKLPGREIDRVPLYMLGVALMKSDQGQDAETQAEARSYFEMGFNRITKRDAKLRSAVWARAHFSRLLHEMGLHNDADEQEKILADNYRNDPLAMMPSEFVELVSDDCGDPAENPIVLRLPNKGKNALDAFRHDWPAVPFYKNGKMIGHQVFKEGPIPKTMNATGVRLSEKMKQREKENEPQVCDYCHRKMAINQCSRCQAAYYCNQTCQKTHWKVHKQTCVAPSKTAT